MASTNELCKVPHRNFKANFFKTECSLRTFVLACSLAGIIVMATSKQTKLIAVQVSGQVLQVENSVKFNTTPAFIYLVAALSVLGFYSLISIVASIALKKYQSNKILFNFILIDLLMVGIASAATGAAGSIAYTGLKGNSHARWGKVCNVYDTFCHHVGASVAFSLVASLTLVILVMLSTYTLYRRSS
ncbi:hypothetical protein ACHQM5_026736 [Ranunculus cassubicifolius]